MQIALSEHFTYRKLLRFPLPSVAMMVFTSIYDIVDGFFVSNFVGATPFAALNFSVCDDNRRCRLYGRRRRYGTCFKNLRGRR